MKFNKKKHKYTKDNKEYISVTTLLDNYFSKFNPTEIARQLAKYPVNKAQKKGVRYWKNLWKKSRDYGTEVHADIQNSILTSTPPKLEESAMALAWLGELIEPVNCMLQPEVIVSNDKHKLAGTIDLMIADYDDKKSILVDWKVVKNISKKSRDKKINSLGLEDCNYNKYALQLNLYAWILKEKGVNIKRMILVQLYDGKLTTYDIPKMDKEVKKILEDLK